MKIFLTLLLAFILGCNKGDSVDSKPVYYGSLSDDVKSFDPVSAYDGISLDLVPSVYETLYQYAYLADTYKIEPLLAADMPKYSKDQLTVTIPLRKDIYFQDDECFAETKGKGRLVKAQDYIYELKRMALPTLESGGWWLLDGKIVGINAFHDKLVRAKKEDFNRIFLEEIEGIQAIDDFTLQLKLIKPYPQLLYALAMSFTAPVPHEAVAKYGDEKGNLTEHPVGTGPYILKDWQRSSRLILEKNPNYHTDFYPMTGADRFKSLGLLADAGKRLPFIDRLDFAVIKEQQPGWLSFLKGKLDRYGIPKDNFSTAVTNRTQLSPELSKKGINLTIETGATYYNVDFNMKDKLVGTNKYLRQAISSAINRDEWITTFTNGRGVKQTAILPVGIPDRPLEAPFKYDFNLARAKELLKKAGYPDGKGLPEINFDMRGSDSVNRQLGDLFSKQFSQIGIKLSVVYNTFPAFLEKLKTGNYQMCYGGWTLDYPDGENVFQLYYGPNKAPGPNGANYDNPDMNHLYEKMATLPSSPERAALVKKMEDLLQEEVPSAYGYYHVSYYITQPWLSNFRASDIILNTYKYLRIDNEIKKKALKKY